MKEKGISRGEYKKLMLALARHHADKGIGYRAKEYMRCYHVAEKAPYGTFPDENEH